VNELREICRNVGLAHSGKKRENLIESIVKYFAPDPETEREYLKTRRELESKGNSTAAPHHALYREEFNAVDLFDKYYYKSTAPYPVKHWRTKMFLSMFQVFFINSFTLYRDLLSYSKNSIRLAEYRELVGMYLIFFSEDDSEKYGGRY
jgi:hypothetical protein